MAVEHFRGTCAHVRALTSMSVVPLVDGIDLYVLRGDGSTLVLISSCCQHSMVPRTCTPTRWWRLLSSILYVQKKLAETRLCVHRPNFTSGTGVIRLFFLFTNPRICRGAKLLRGLLCSKPDASVSFSFAVLHMYLVPPLRLATAFTVPLPQLSAPRESGSQVKARSVLDHPRTCRGEAQAPTQVDVCKASTDTLYTVVSHKLSRNAASRLVVPTEVFPILGAGELKRLLSSDSFGTCIPWCNQSNFPPDQPESR